EWRQGANQAKLELAIKGIKCIEKVIDAEGLLKYSLENGLRVDQAARASYAQWLHEKDLNEVLQVAIPEIEEEERSTTRTHSYTPPVDQLLTYTRSEEHTSELQSRENLVCRLLLEKKTKMT